MVTSDAVSFFATGHWLRQCSATIWELPVCVTNLIWRELTQCSWLYLHHLTIVYIEETMTTKIVFYVYASYYKSQQIRVVLLKVPEAYLDGIISKKIITLYISPSTLYLHTLSQLRSSISPCWVCVQYNRVLYAVVCYMMNWHTDIHAKPP